MSFDATYPFDLPSLPPSVNEQDPIFFKPLIRARAELAELNGYCSALPNPMLLISPAIIKESLASSEVENIHTTLVDALQNQMFPEKQQREPDKEVLRYREAILEGAKQLNRIPISTRLIQTVQQTLIPQFGGHYRKQQNQIANIATGKVIYTPPMATQIPSLLSNWEMFVNESKMNLDPLVKCAIAHYQFEAIHPFLDGNGRTGRILMVLQLIHEKIIKLPVLYISGYINQKRSLYYEKLKAVTVKQDWNSFIMFFLEGFYLQAKETKMLLFKMMALYEQYRIEIKQRLPKIYSADLIEQLFSYPVITPIKLGENLNAHYTTASRYLKSLEKNDFLQSSKVGKYHFFLNKKLIKILSQ